ncbi:hypothetical protein ACVNF4_08100 [Streptomyces sp. S6]
MVTAKHIGQAVTDGNRRGILMDIDSTWEDPSQLPAKRRRAHRAFVRPEGGGVEWDVPPSALCTIAEWEAGANVEQPA